MKNYFRIIRILIIAALFLAAGCAGSPDQHNENRSATPEGVCRVDWNTDLLHEPDQQYYLADDPGEQVNQAGDPEYSGKLKELQSLLSRWVEELPGSFAEF